MKLRNGQWVKFVEPTIDVNGRSAPLSEFAADAHKLPDGRIVGIFQSRRRDHLGGVIPAHICPVDSGRGDNLSVLNILTAAEETIQFIEAEAKRFAIARCSAALCVAWPTIEDLVAKFELCPVLELAELPPGRKVAEGFVLRP